MGRSFFISRTVDGRGKACYTEKMTITRKRELLTQGTGKKRRVWEIDFLRGFCIFLMIIDHMMFDFMMVPEFSLNFYRVDNAFFEFMADFAYWYWMKWNFRTVTRFTVVFIFLFLSGISCAFSRSQANRFRKLAGAAGAVTLVTVSADMIVPGLYITIIFGILHILALNVLIYAAMKKLWPNRYFYLVLGAVLTAGGLAIPFWANLPWLNALSVDGFSKILLGTAVYGSDCYGILPYTGFFLLGAAFGEAVYAQKRSLLPRLDGRWNKAFSFVGRHTIWVYLAHQVVVFVAIMGAAAAVGYQFF